MKNRIISIAAVITILGTLFTGFTNVSADCINDKILIEYAKEEGNVLSHIDFITNLPPREEIRHLFADVTNDGNEELVAICDNVIEVYTVSNGEVKMIVQDPIGYSGGEGFISYYDNEYYVGWDSYQGGSYMTKTLSKYINGERTAIYETREVTDYDTGSVTFLINGEQVSYDDYDHFLETVIYGSKIPYNDFSTLDELINHENLIKIYVYNERIHTDTVPVIVDDRTLVPIRAVAEALNYEVDWDQQKQQVTLHSDSTGKWVSIVIGDYSINSNDKQIPIDVPAQVMNDRTYIPLRAIAEALNCTVDWNDNERAVYIK